MDYDEQGKLMAEYLHTRSREHHLQSEGESSHMSPSFASQNHRIMWLLELEPFVFPPASLSSNLFLRVETINFNFGTDRGTRKTAVEGRSC